jgi:hypothetical protein
MNIDMVLLKTTLKIILKETVGVSGAIVRVELEVGEFWTFVYFESTLPEAHDVSEKSSQVFISGCGFKERESISRSST